MHWLFLAIPTVVVERQCHSSGGGVPNFRFAVPCGQRGSEENTANNSKNGPKLYIKISRNVLGTAQNTVNYGKTCVFFCVV